MSPDSSQQFPSFIKDALSSVPPGEKKQIAGNSYDAYSFTCHMLYFMTHLSRGDSSDDESVILNVSDDDDDGFAPARAAPVLPVESVEDTANEEKVVRR